MKEKYLRLDLLFSYWIFAWYLLYITGIFKYYSPLFAIIIATIENFITALVYLYRGISRYNFIKFIIINIFLKIIPLITLRNEKIILKDIYFTFILFIVYVIYVSFNSEEIKRYLSNILYGNINNRGNIEDLIYDNIYTKLINYYLYDKGDKTIVNSLYDKILSTFFKKS